MKINDIFPGKLIKTDDLEGQPLVINIQSRALEEVGTDGSFPVVRWAGTQLGFVVKKTNGMTIASFLGEETTDWVGKDIELYPTKTQMGGKMVPCIRVRKPGTYDLDSI